MLAVAELRAKAQPERTTRKRRIAITAPGRAAIRRDQRRGALGPERVGNAQRSRLSPRIISRAGVTQIAESMLSRVATITAIETESAIAPGRSSVATSIAKI